MWNLKKHFCEVNGCSEKAPYHLTWAESRATRREEHVCERHASGLMDDYRCDERIGKGSHATLEGATCFDIELVLISEIHDTHTIFLREVGGSANLPVLTGIFEAWSIVLKLNKYETPRPLTHEAMLSAITAMGGQMSEVLIDRMEGNTYYATARVNHVGELVCIDMRPSDAFNLAITSNCPVFFADELVRSMASRNPAWPSE